MFSWTEILLIAVVALIFIGPKELPAVLLKLGQLTAKLRRSADEFRRHFEESMRESGYQDLHKNIQDLRALNPSSQLRATLESAINPDLTPKPVPVPAAAPAEPVTAEALDRISQQAQANAFAAEAAPATAGVQDASGQAPVSQEPPPAPVPLQAALGAEAALEPSKDRAA
jgi:sec-independent protein translocase protein TatB